MAAKFQVTASESGFRWTLTSQGRTLATSPTYARRALAEKAIDSFRMVAVNAPVIDTTLPPAKTTTGKVARATGRTVAGATSGSKRKKADKKADKKARSKRR